MFGKAARGWKVLAAALLCLVPVLGAAQGSAPSSAPAAVSLDTATLKRYVGNYGLGSPDLQAVVTITLAGTQLRMQGSGQPAFDINPQSATRFLLKAGEMEIDVEFVSDGKGPATALIVHPNGQDVTMPRIDNAVAAQFNAKLAARVQAKTPQPGTQAAVNDWIEHMQKGQALDYTKMSGPLAEAMKAQFDQISGMISSLGALQSLTFQNVEASGADTYVAKFLSGSLLISIALDPKGITTGMLLRPVTP